MTTRSFTPSMMALAAGALAIMSTLTGCSGDDYYCDANGCYYCDGVGCRPAEPPARSPCRGDYECSANQVCTNLGCATTCASSADCAQGWVCRIATGAARGICARPTESPTPNPGTCSTNAQCEGGTVCVNGTCTRPTCDGGVASCACTADSQCAAGNVCVSGRCTPRADTCQFDSQCGAGRVCVNQQCRAGCSATTACPTGQVCRIPTGETTGVCEDRPAGECTTDAMCGAGRRCINSTCFARCTTSAECGAGLYCSDLGACQPDTRRRPTCTSDAQCAAGSRCLDGVCRRPCTTTDECLRTDVSYRNCAPIAYLMTREAYCQTDNEYRPTCARQNDCAAGQVCQNAVCRSN